MRLVGRLVDVVIDAAGAWSLSATVADGLADAVPLPLIGDNGACGTGGCAGPGPVHQIAPRPER
jgi:hypothetical protein